MEALEHGVYAPRFELVGLDGKTYSNRTFSADSLLLAVFFKTSCPTSQFTLPFIERLYQGFSCIEQVRIWGISQDLRDETSTFAHEYGLSFPILLDTPGYNVSRLYQLTHVPTAFLIDGQGKILVTSVGFWKADWLRLSQVIAGRLDLKEKTLFLEGEAIPSHQYG